MDRKISFRVPGTDVVLTGTEGDVRSVVSRYGISRDKFDVQFYESSTKGRIPISYMHTKHIKNAVLKLMRQFVDDLYKENNARKIVMEIFSFFDTRGGKPTVFKELLKELATRTDLED